MARVLRFAAIVIALVGCRKEDPAAKEVHMLTVKSGAFEAGSTIPRRFTGEGNDVSPPLEIGGVPTGAKELALVCDDPDAPRAEPWVHWVVYRIPPTATRFAEGRAPDGVVEGQNDFGQRGYGGPMPPPGHGVHHYHFTAYALDAPVELRPGASKAELLTAMEGHVLARGELIGTYQRR